MLVTLSLSSLPGRCVPLAAGNKLSLGEMGSLEHHRTGGLSQGQLEIGGGGDQLGQDPSSLGR